MRAVTVAIFGSSAVGDGGEARCDPARELGVGTQNAGIDDEGSNARSAGGPAEAAAEGQAALVGPVQSPGGRRLRNQLSADDAVNLNPINVWIVGDGIEERIGRCSGQ